MYNCMLVSSAAEPVGTLMASWHDRACPFRVRWRLVGTGYRFECGGGLRRRLAGTGYWVPGTGYRVPGTGYQVPGTGYHLIQAMIVNLLPGRWGGKPAAWQAGGVAVWRAGGI
jgi:hypothetical protein